MSSLAPEVKRPTALPDCPAIPLSNCAQYFRKENLSTGLAFTLWARALTQLPIAANKIHESLN